MLGQKYFKQQGKGAVINNDYFSERAKIRLVTMVSFTLLLLMCIYPETSFAALNSLEAQLDKERRALRYARQGRGRRGAMA